MPGFLEDVQLVKLQQWFVEEETITWEKAVAALYKELNVSDEIADKLNEHMKPTATIAPSTLQTPSNNMTFYGKECNSNILSCMGVFCMLEM